MSCAAYAGEKDVAQVEFTGGVDFEKERISTFNDSKQISGSAESGTVIKITVYTVNLRGNLRERESYEIEVGKSGLFSQSIDLRLGENLVEFSACLEGKEDFIDEVVINRKERGIKYKLENEIYLPGSGN